MSIPPFFPITLGWHRMNRRGIPRVIDDSCKPRQSSINRWIPLLPCNATKIVGKRWIEHLQLPLSLVQSKCSHKANFLLTHIVMKYTPQPNKARHLSWSLYHSSQLTQSSRPTIYRRSHISLMHTKLLRVGSSKVSQIPHLGPC